MPKVDINDRTSQLLEYVRRQQNNQKFMKSIELGSTFFLISFFIIVAIKPAVNTIFSLQGEIQSKKILTKQMKGKITNVITAQEIFSQVQKNYLLVESSLPNSPHYAHAANQILKTASASGVGIEKIPFNLSPGKDESLGDNVKQFSHTFSLNSPFQNLLNFINNLSNNRRIFKINNIRLSTQEESTSSAEINLNMEVNTFYWGQ